MNTIEALSKAKSLASRIENILIENNKPMSIGEISSIIEDKPKSSIRGRIYDNIGKRFKKVARGVYEAININSKVLVVESNGRDLSCIQDESIDAIITDHPWLDKKSNKGGDRKFTNSYNCFNYELNDFKEKARVLRSGCFLVEIIPAENANNYKYLFTIKKMAEECGLLYYAKVPWKKGTFISNTGRKAKNTEDIMFFSKGKARKLRIDVKKTKNTGSTCYMSGTSNMLPTNFNVQPASRKNKVHQSEKPVELYKQILDYISKKGEIILDQFAGSMNLAKAILEKERIGIMIEYLHSNVISAVNRLNAILI